MTTDQPAVTHLTQGGESGLSHGTPKCLDPTSSDKQGGPPISASNAGMRSAHRAGRRPIGPDCALAGLLLSVALIQIIAFPGRFERDPPMLGPQENVRFELAQQWVHEGRPSFDLTVPPGASPDVIPALTPRDAALQRLTVVPKDFPYAIGLAALFVLVDPRLALAISALSALALLAAVAALARRLGGRWSGVGAAAVLTTTGAFWAGTGGLLNTGAAIAVTLVVGMLLLCPPAHRAAAGGRASASASQRRDVLAGIAFGIGVGLHHDIILLAAGLVVPFVLPPLGGAARARRIAAGTLIAALPGFVYYAWLHGSPFTTGYAVGAGALAVPGENFFEVLTVDPGMLLEHVRRYVLRPEVVLLVAAALLACFYASRPTARSLGKGLLLGGLPYLAFAGSRPLYGVDHLTFGASFPRYAAPVVALLACIATAGPWAGPPVSRRTRATALWISALIGVALLAYTAGGPLDQRRQVLQSTRLRAQVLDTVEPEALVVTARGDKLLWPHRSTITAAYLVRDPAEGIRYGPAMYDVLPTPRRLALVVAHLVDAGEQVYVMSDSFPPYLAGLDLELRLAGVRREPTAVGSLFRITADSPRHN